MEDAAARASTKGIIAAVACCIILSTTGGGATLVNITIPGQCEGMGITTMQAGVQTFTATLCAFLFGLVGTKLINKVTPKYALMLGSVAECISLLIIALTHNYVVYCLAGVFGGFALAIGTFAAIAGICGQFFGVRSGRIFGVVTGVQIFILAAMIFGAGQLLAVYDYRLVLLISAGLCIVVGIGLNLLFVRQPDASDLAMSESTVADAKKKEAAKAEKKGHDGLLLKQAFKFPALYAFIVGMMAGAIITGAMSTYGSTFFVSFGMTKTTASTFMSIYTLFCGIHVLWTGFFQAKFGSRVFIVTQYLGIILGIVLLVIWANTQSVVFVILGLLFVAFIKPVNSTPALLIPDLFGRRDYVAFNSLSTGFYYGGVCISMLTTAAIMTALGGATALVYMGAMAVIALIFFTISLILSPYRKMKRDGK